MASNWTNPWAVARFCLIGAVGLSIDLTVKNWADVHLSLPDEDGVRPSVDVLPGWLRLEWTPNHGAALGFFQGDRWLFLIVSAVAIGFLCYLFTFSGREQPGYQVILGLLLGGVLGNMYDRVRLGYVRDMIHLFPGRLWPPAVAAHLPAFWTTPEWFPWIFNVADSLLCVGVGLMLVHGLVYGGPPKPPDSEAKAEAPSPHAHDHGTD